MSEKKQKAADDWRCRGWSDHQTSRFDATHGTTLLERLQWLESAAELARRLSPANRRARPDSRAVAEPAAAYPAKSRPGARRPRG